MKRNNDTVYIADSQEYSQACVKYADYINCEVAQRIARVHAIDLNAWDFSELLNRILAIIANQLSLQNLIARTAQARTGFELAPMSESRIPVFGRLYVESDTGNQQLKYKVITQTGVIFEDSITIVKLKSLEGKLQNPTDLQMLQSLLRDILAVTSERNHTPLHFSKQELVKQSIHEIRQMYRMDLIEQYLPLLRSTMPHRRPSDLIAKVRSVEIKPSNALTVLTLIDQLRPYPKICQSLSLLQVNEDERPQQLIQQACALIADLEGEQRRRATAAIVFDRVFVAGKKCVSRDAVTDPLDVLAADLSAIGVVDNTMQAFLQEFLNSQNLLMAANFHDQQLQKTFDYKEPIIEVHLNYNPQQSMVVLNIVCKYPKLFPKHQRAVVEVQAANSMSRVYAQSGTTLHLTCTKEEPMSPIKAVYSRFTAVQVVLVHGSLDIFDQTLRDYYIKTNADLLSEKIVKGQIGDKNTDVLVHHMISDFEGITDLDELVTKLTESQNPLAIMLMASANADIMIKIFNDDDLLQCFCTHKYCDKYLELLAFLYVKQKALHSEIDKLRGFIRFVREKESKLTDSRKVAIFKSDYRDAIKAKYLTAALFTYQDEPKDIVVLLEDPEIFAALSNIGALVNLALRFRAVAEWLIVNEKLKHDQIIKVLHVHPEIYSERKKHITEALNSTNLRKLVFENTNDYARKVVLQVVFRNASFYKKLCKEQSNPNVLLMCCVEAKIKFFSLSDEVKENILTMLKSADLDVINSYLKHVARNFEAEEFRLFSEEFIKAKMEESSVFSAYVLLFCEKIQKKPQLDYGYTIDGLTSLARILPKFPRLGIILLNDKVRRLLSEAVDRKLPNQFFRCIIENANFDRFSEVKFQILAFKILTAAELTNAIYSNNSEKRLVNLFARDQCASEVFMHAGVHEDEYKLNLILKHASAHQLICILLPSIQQVQDLAQESDSTEKMKLMLEKYDQKAFDEYSKQRFYQQSMINFLEKVRKIILTTPWYLNKLFHANELNESLRWMLFRIFPEVAGIEKVEFATSADILSTDAKSRIRAIKRCGARNLARMLIDLCKDEPLARECLPYLFGKQDIMTVLMSNVATDVNTVIDLIIALRGLQDSGLTQKFVNEYLISGYTNSDIRKCILTTPTLQTLLIQESDISLIVVFICLFGASFNNHSDWLMLFNRLINAPLLFKIYKTMLCSHQPHSYAALLHFYALGNQEILTEGEINLALMERNFDTRDFITLVFVEYKCRDKILCRTQLAQNAALRAEVFRFASISEMVTMLQTEYIADIHSPIVATLLSPRIFDDILRLARAEELLSIARLDKKFHHHLIKLYLHNPLQRQFITQCQQLFVLLLDSVELDQFLMMAILIKEPNAVVLARLRSMTELQNRSADRCTINLSAKQLMNLLIAAEHQKYDFGSRDEDSVELAQLLRNHTLVFETIARFPDVNIIIQAIPVLLRFLPESKPNILALFSRKDFVEDRLDGAFISCLVDFFCDQEIIGIITEKQSVEFQKKMRILLFQCYIHSGYTQLMRLSNRVYIKMIIAEPKYFTANAVLAKNVIAPRLIFLLDNLYPDNPRLVEKCLKENAHIFELLTSTSENFCLFIGTAIYRGSEYVRSEISNKFGSNESWSSSSRKPARPSQDASSPVQPAGQQDKPNRAARRLTFTTGIGGRSENSSDSGTKPLQTSPRANSQSNVKK